MHSFFAAALLLASSVSAANISVTVGFNGTSDFNPPNITANVGDTVAFIFASKNNSVTQSSLSNPCQPLQGGVNSGFVAVAANATELPQFSLAVNKKTPLFFFNAQTAVVNVCQQGAVFAINAGALDFAQFVGNANANGGNETSALNSTATVDTTESVFTATATVTVTVTAANSAVAQTSLASLVSQGDTGTTEFGFGSTLLRSAKFTTGIPSAPLATAVTSSKPEAFVGIVVRSNGAARTMGHAFGVMVGIGCFVAFVL